MKTNNAKNIISFVVLVVGFSIIAPCLAMGETSQTPPAMRHLYRDTITYFNVPANSSLEITFAKHNYNYQDAIFDIYDTNGNFYDRVIFACDPVTGFANVLGTKKSVNFTNSGTYKMVAYGPDFIYDLRFNGVQYDWGFIVLGIPHKPQFRLSNPTDSLNVYFKTYNNFTFYAGSEWYSPSRTASVKVLDNLSNQKANLQIITNVQPGAYRTSAAITKANTVEEFWHANITDADASGSTTSIAIWTSEASYNHPMGPATILTPAPEYYFEPVFNSRTVAADIGPSTAREIKPGAANIFHLSSSDPLYNIMINAYKDLNFKTSNYYVLWRVREPANDDADPNHINWSGFNFSGVNTAFSMLNKLKTQYNVNIKPVLNFEWESQAFITTNPRTWTDAQMEEFAEFVEATVTYCVAPDLAGRPGSVYEITSIKLLNEVNLTMQPGLSDSQIVSQRSALRAKYIQILGKVINRIKNHSDPRINSVKISIPGIGIDVFGESQKEYWINGVLDNVAEENIDIISWDPYFKYLIEELPNYGTEINAIKTILQNRGISKEIGFDEFGIYGGPPTFDNIYGSKYSQLHTFSSVANAVNAGLDYPIYFNIIDGDDRHKGLISSAAADLPYSSYSGYTRKPQFYAMQVVGKIAKGAISEVTCDKSQIDLLSSFDGAVYRIGLLNRYEAATNITLNIPGNYSVQWCKVENDSLNLIPGDSITNNININMEPWTLYYLELTLLNDETPPTIPQNLVATAVSSAQINLLWSASTDNVGVAGYKVYMDGSYLATVTTSQSHNVTGLESLTTYSFTVLAYDAAGNESNQSTQASATTLAHPNNPPVANNQSITTAEDTAKPITLTAGDADGDPLTYSIVAQPSHGLLSGTAPNVTYTPALNYNGSDSFTFKVNDGSLDSNIAAVSISISAVNDAPILNTIANITVNEGATVIISPSAYDVDGDALNYSYSGWMNSSSYTTGYNDAGIHTVTVTVSDGQLTDSQNVVITVLDIKYSLTLTTQNGSVNKTPNQSSYDPGASVQLAATPASGYAFSNWSGDLTGNTNPVTITMNGNKTVTANFELLPPLPSPTPPPAVPSGLIATAISRSQINLTWVDNSDNEAGFKIERGTISKGKKRTINFTQIATVGANVMSFNNTGLSRGKLYYYRVRAYNSVGNSAYSETASAKTPR